MGRIMAHGINRLSARAVETAKSSGLIADGGGLYLQVSKSGAKSWLYKFMLNGRSREIDAAGINPAAGRRQTGQGRGNIVPYLFS